MIAALADGDNDLIASHASLWELAIKSQSRPSSIPPLTEIEAAWGDAGIRTYLPIKPLHIFGIQKLPPIHGDPFDRMLISQAQHEGLTLVTRDSYIHQYPVALLW